MPTAIKIPPVVSYPTMGTSLPGSPVDGQQAILVDSTSSPTYAWMFQYLASASKWLFIGGSPAITEVATAEFTNSTTYVDLTTVGPSFTIPRTGQYEIAFAFNQYGQNIPGGAAVKLGSAATSVNEGFSSGAGANGAGAGNAISSATRVGGSKMFSRALNAGDVLKVQYLVEIGASGNTFANRTLSVRPIWVT